LLNFVDNWDHNWRVASCIEENVSNVFFDFLF